MMAKERVSQRRAIVELRRKKRKRELEALRRKRAATDQYWQDVYAGKIVPYAGG